MASWDKIQDDYKKKNFADIRDPSDGTVQKEQDAIWDAVILYHVLENEGKNNSNRDITVMVTVTEFHKCQMITPNFLHHKTIFTMKSINSNKKANFSCRNGDMKQTKIRPFRTLCVLQDQIGGIVIYLHIALSWSTRSPGYTPKSFFVCWGI